VHDDRLRSTDPNGDIVAARQHDGSDRRQSPGLAGSDAGSADCPGSREKVSSVSSKHQPEGHGQDADEHDDAGKDEPRSQVAMGWGPRVGTPRLVKRGHRRSPPART
jgi:hypothetical protein